MVPISTVSAMKWLCFRKFGNVKNSIWYLSCAMNFFHRLTVSPFLKGQRLLIRGIHLVSAHRIDGNRGGATINELWRMPIALKFCVIRDQQYLPF
jgi:hypothetical protein